LFFFPVLYRWTPLSRRFRFSDKPVFADSQLKKLLPEQHFCKKSSCLKKIK